MQAPRITLLGGPKKGGFWKRVGDLAYKGTQAIMAAVVIGTVVAVVVLVCIKVIVAMVRWTF